MTRDFLNSIEYTKENPFPATLLSRKKLSKAGSNKQVFHITLSSSPKIRYKEGDSVAIFPQNPISFVESTLSALNADGRQHLFLPSLAQPESLFNVLLQRVSLTKTPLSILKQYRLELSPLTPFWQTCSHLVSFRPSLVDLLSCLPPLLPRFYSIASSPQPPFTQFDLLVARESFVWNNSSFPAVCSSFLTSQATSKTPIPLYISPTKQFALPDDASRDIIMIAAGTGIAPFRAFMQKRQRCSARGKHWLFFGEQQRRADFYYEDFWKKLEEENQLLLSLAFSRDQQEKIYIQHRMEQQAALFWQWVNRGALIYVCGDAKKMAKSVREMFISIAQNEGKMSISEAKRTLFSLIQQKRFLQDVY